MAGSRCRTPGGEMARSCWVNLPVTSAAGSVAWGQASACKRSWTAGSTTSRFPVPFGTSGPLLAQSHDCRAPAFAERPCARARRREAAVVPLAQDRYPLSVVRPALVRRGPGTKSRAVTRRGKRETGFPVRIAFPRRGAGSPTSANREMVPRCRTFSRNALSWARNSCLLEHVRALSLDRAWPRPARGAIHLESNASVRVSCSRRDGTRIAPSRVRAPDPEPEQGSALQPPGVAASLVTAVAKWYVRRQVFCIRRPFPDLGGE